MDGDPRLIDELQEELLALERAKIALKEEDDRDEKEVAKVAARIEEIEEIVVRMSRLKKKMKEKAAALEQATAEGESSWDAPPPSRRQDACASAGGTAYWPGRSKAPSQRMRGDVAGRPR